LNQVGSHAATLTQTPANFDPGFGFHAEIVYSAVANTSASEPTWTCNGDQLKSRVYYQSVPPAVILQKDGKDILSYTTVEELVETHIKGLLAKQDADSEAVLDLLKKYRSPSDISKF